MLPEHTDELIQRTLTFTGTFRSESEERLHFVSTVSPLIFSHGASQFYHPNLKLTDGSMSGSKC